MQQQNQVAVHLVKRRLVLSQNGSTQVGQNVQKRAVRVYKLGKKAVNSNPGKVVLNAIGAIQPDLLSLVQLNRVQGGITAIGRIAHVAVAVDERKGELMPF